MFVPTFSHFETLDGEVCIGYLSTKVFEVSLWRTKRHGTTASKGHLTGQGYHIVYPVMVSKTEFDAARDPAVQCVEDLYPRQRTAKRSVTTATFDSASLLAEPHVEEAEESAPPNIWDEPYVPRPHMNEDELLKAHTEPAGELG